MADPTSRSSSLPLDKIRWLPYQTGSSEKNKTEDELLTLQSKISSTAVATIQKIRSLDQLEEVKRTVKTDFSTIKHDLKKKEEKKQKVEALKNSKLGAIAQGTIDKKLAALDSKIELLRIEKDHYGILSNEIKNHEKTLFMLQGKFNGFVSECKANMPPAVHYDKITKPTQEKKRTDMNNFLNSLGRVPTGKITFRDINEWAIDQNKIDAKTIYTVGENFSLTGEEVKELINSTKVSYDSTKVDKQTLSQFLSIGSDTKSIEDSRMARGRCVGQDAVLLVNQNAETVKRNTNEPLEKFRLYTMNGPNLSGIDNKDFIIQGQDGFILKYHDFKNELQRVISHFLHDCKEDGIEVPVLAGISMGVFLPTQFKNLGYRALGEALRDAMKAQGFSNVIFADPNQELCAAVKDTRDLQGVAVIQGSCLDVIAMGAKKGIKMGLLNPGDNRCYPGENWEKGHFAFEEMLALYTTLVLQHPNVATTVKDPNSYHEVTL